MNREMTDFFVAGGTLPLQTPSYVRRPADDKLFKMLLAGAFCYVLTPRQMGKSSLMIWTAARLREQGVKTAILDLTRIGTVTVEQWYLGLLTRLERVLHLSQEPISWWQAQPSLSPAQRFTTFLRDVILREIEGQVVIFIDEIDTTINLPFSDDFFAAIRAIYQARREHPAFKRLTFVFLGVATLFDLVKDSAQAPFDLGHRILLPDFSSHEALVLQEGLEATYPGQGQAIFERIYDWTNGHPYLTQYVCWNVVRTDQRHWSAEKIDRLIETLFFDQAGSLRRETNLQFVQNKVLKSPQKRELLTLYEQVYKGKKVSDSQSLIQNQLKLSGLVKVENRHLTRRNRIYHRAFELPWIRKNRPSNWTLLARSFGKWLPKAIQ